MKTKNINVINVISTFK